MNLDEQAVGTHATAARESGKTLWRLPVPWLDRRKSGDGCAFSQPAPRRDQAVLREKSEKVRTPRSQSMTCNYLRKSTYRRPSGTHRAWRTCRAEQDRFLARPARFSKEKFCMLRAPIWMTSAYSSTRSSDSLSIASVTSRIRVWRELSKEF